MHRICEQIKPLPEECSDLQPIIERMLAGDPEERSKTLQEFLDDLPQSPPPAAESLPHPVVAPDRRKSARMRYPVAIGSLFVLLLAAFAAWQWLPLHISEEDSQKIQAELPPPRYRYFDRKIGRVL